MKVLFVYPNSFLTTSIPMGIAYMSAVLKENGIEVELFDTTFYKTRENQHLKRERAGQVKIADYSFFEDSTRENVCLVPDFRKKISEFCPDLIAYSIVEDNWNLAAELIASTKGMGIPTVVGGVFPSFAFNANNIEKFYNKIGRFYYCIGEGEKSLLDFCNSLKSDPRINSCLSGELIDINNLPMPDYEIFHHKMLYRPMSGEIKKTLMIETQRGCPYNCTFCNSRAQKDLYRGLKFHRNKNISQLSKELKYLINKYSPEFIYLVGDSFLFINEQEWSDFCTMYSEYKIPFWMNTRPETVTKARVKRLEKIGCARCNIGIEHGDYYFRKNIIKRNVTDQQIIDAAKCFEGSTIKLVCNNIIGFPTETEELMQKTINLNKVISKYTEKVNAYLFTPYHGTVLRDLAVKTGMISDDFICSDVWKVEDSINYPISSDVLCYVQNNFSLLTS